MDSSVGYQSVDALQLVLFSFALIAVLAAFLLVALFTYRLMNQKAPLSPYSGRPMRRGEDLPLSSVAMVMKFLYYKERSYDNRVFPMKRAMICRETGRIFPFSVSKWGFQRVDWSFLQKRYPGVYVSWGSLTEMQKDEIRELYEAESLKGFQTERSSPHPSPRRVGPEFALIKPGPLYVDLDTKVLLGWKIVPGTSLEVLVVQKPGRFRKKAVDRIIQRRKKK